MSPQVSLIVKPPSLSIPIIRADARRLTQILHNILSNAVKFTTEGEIVVEMKEGRKDRDSVEFIVTITDTGIGMSESVRSHLFQPFSIVILSRMVLERC